MNSNTVQDRIKEKKRELAQLKAEMRAEKKFEDIYAKGIHEDVLMIMRVIGNKLSLRQCEVLFHVARGLSNREIAGTLCVSEKTIKFHMTAIKAVTNCASRLKLALTILEKTGRLFPMGTKPKEKCRDDGLPKGEA